MLISSDKEPLSPSESQLQNLQTNPPIVLPVLSVCLHFYEILRMQSHYLFYATAANFQSGVDCSLISLWYLFSLTHVRMHKEQSR